MKLSSRKQLLKEADDVLKNISKRRVDELDWEEHEMAITDPDYRAKLKTDFLQWKLAKDLYQIEKKYAYANTVEKQKEIDDLLEMIEILRKHFSPEKWKQIPKDPEQQTELQKLIVNAPPPDLRVDPIKNFAEYLIKDPETGMYYHKRRGVPEIPPNWKEDYLEWNYQKSLTVPWDYTRDWFYNAMKLVLSWGRET